LLQADSVAAVAPFRRAAGLCQDTPETPRLQLAEALLALEQLDEAEQHLRRLLARNPDHPRALLVLGRLALARGRLDEGLSHLGRAAGHPGTAKQAHLLLAEVHQRRGDARAAGRELSLAERLPDPPPWPDPYSDELEQLRRGRQARLARADRLLDQERVVEAIALLRQAARDYPDAAWVWLAL